MERALYYNLICLEATIGWASSLRYGRATFCYKGWQSTAFYTGVFQGRLQGGWIGEYKRSVHTKGRPKATTLAQVMEGRLFD
jgi:hypothetical protein